MSVDRVLSYSGLVHMKGDFVATMIASSNFDILVFIRQPYRDPTVQSISQVSFRIE
jgi:hypothetical protein